MPKQQHTRSSSSSHNRYSNPNPMPGVSVTLAPSAMPITYSARPVLPLNTTNLTSANLSTANYYNAMPSSASVSMSTHQYDPYPQQATTMAPQPVPSISSHRPSSGAWTPQDDQNLIAARQQGLNWSQIQTQYFPSKSPNACRKRHERLMERKGADDFDTKKLERLAEEYMSMRKEIWQGLAARTGEKWSTVETKCMSNGLKNLQAAARSAGRRKRQEGSSSSGYHHGYADDDSGISGIGLTPVDDQFDGSYSSPETSSSHSHAGSTYAMQHHQSMQIPYSTGYASSYSSSSSTHGYGMHGHHSQDSSPYITQRLPSVDMGIEAIINQPGRGHHHGH
ncbi:hypothetical protein GGR57DRAFT_507490 [Xylariaceae sp. FL1272]|nr:hypothetical protein GGR57DRAFT_507490 [Xylariaceae sp. FL1272]